MDRYQKKKITLTIFLKFLVEKLQNVIHGKLLLSAFVWWPQCFNLL